MSSDARDGLFGMRPILCVDDAARAITYYVDVLGFRLGWAWNAEQQRFIEPGEAASVNFALVGYSDTVQIMLSQRSQGVPGMWVHLDVDTEPQLCELHARWQAKGARIHEPPSLRPWGTVEMRITDLDDNVFRVSAPPGQSHASSS